jgi:hypothetical protein
LSATTSLQTLCSASRLLTSALSCGPATRSAPGTSCSVADSLLSRGIAHQIGPSQATPLPPFQLHCISPLTQSFVVSVSSSAKGHVSSDDTDASSSTVKLACRPVQELVEMIYGNPAGLPTPVPSHTLTTCSGSLDFGLCAQMCGIVCRCLTDGHGAGSARRPGSQRSARAGAPRRPGAEQPARAHHTRSALSTPQHSVSDGFERQGSRHGTR